MHQEYADNKYSAIINLYNNMVIMFIKRVLGAAAGISCRTLAALPFHDIHTTNILKDSQG